MRKFLLLVLFIFIASCNSDTKEYKFEFYPAWVNPTEYQIDLKNKELKIHSFEHLNWSKEHDTIITHLSKQFKINNQHLNDFISEIENIAIDSSFVNGDTGYLDGFGFKFSKTNFKKDTITLTSLNPKRNARFEIDYKILDAFFKLTYKTINDNKSTSLTENIQDYLSYGLPIKKTNDNPLEYRVWGSIYECDTTDSKLIKFLEKLPNDEPIIFDTRNGEFSSCSNKVLENHINKKKVYFYGNFRLNQSIEEIKKLRNELKIAEDNPTIYSVGRINVSLREEIKYQEGIIYRAKDLPNMFSTKAEIIKTIANTVYN